MQMDELNLTKIIAMQTLALERERICTELGRLKQPLSDDIDRLPALFELYKKTINSHMHVYNRKKFLFVILYIFSPGTLVGERMRTGLRTKLSELFDLSTSTPISDNCNGLLTQYQNYRDFRRDTNLLFRAFAEALRD